MSLPTAAILDSLATIANAWRGLAVGAHAALALMVITRRPRSRRAVVLCLTVPLASVSLLAWWSGHPFNGVVFLLLALIAAKVATTVGTSATVLDRSLVNRSIGAALVIFGLVYPHFVVAEPWITYLYASPFALIPCPTLSVIVGFSLLMALESRAWSRLMAAAGLTYGVIGVTALGVGIDGVLIAGAATLLVKSVRQPDSSGRHFRQATAA
jgi:hypothetical protein